MLLGSLIALCLLLKTFSILLFHWIVAIVGYIARARPSSFYLSSSSNVTGGGSCNQTSTIRPLVLPRPRPSPWPLPICRGPQ
ncbi:hypothetical protein BGX38DRAFT_1154040 [Terfezia claveryi]|nr:hypothetical protein BGX38DRAFT_1154040 [Terfezia claveryi]